MSIKFKLDEGKLYFFKNTNYLYTLDMNELEHAFENLAKTNLVTTEKSTDDHIFGSITTYANNQTIMTTIPYDNGWNVYVDGKQVETYSIYGDSLMAFDIENAGEHEIEFRYMPKIYVIGGIISGISFIAFIGIWIFETRKSKKEVLVVSSSTDDEIATEEKTEGEN